MATHAATTRNISGLARALAQHGLMSEGDAEAAQAQARTSGITFVEQVLAGKKMSSTQLAAFGCATWQRWFDARAPGCLSPQP